MQIKLSKRLETIVEMVPVTGDDSCVADIGTDHGFVPIRLMELEKAGRALAMDVRNAFFILSEEEQMIVGLSVFGGYNSTEIGKILSLKPGTVRVKRSRALEKMQCVLDGRTFYE